MYFTHEKTKTWLEKMLHINNNVLCETVEAKIIVPSQFLRSKFKTF